MVRRGSSAFLSLLLLVALFPALPAGADHTPLPTSVSIPGSFNSELGCAEDWQPACAEIELNADLLDNGDGVWREDFTIPAGDWAYKAALNDAWDENYGAGGVPGGDDISLSLPADTDVRFYYSHDSHWITDNVTSVIASAPGSYQAALGCLGDWQPECLRSWLQDLDGDGIYEFTTSAIPAGNHEFKVAINESWDENYGAGGVANGPNLPFTVSAGDQVTFTFDSATNVPDVVVEPLVSDEDLAQPALRHPFQDEVLYFAIPDRFNDGDTENNCGDYAGVCVEGDTQENVLTHGYLPEDRGYYHGGDIKGLHDKLDYLEGLGITAIWVGPIYKNKTVQPDSSNLYGHSSGYHGYWIEDFLQVDPHLGSNAEFKALVDDAHSRNIQVFMDVVTNHTADVVQLTDNAGYRDKADFPYTDADGVAFDDSDFAYFGQDDYTFPEVNESSFPYVPFVPAGEETVKNPAWLNDPLLYHNRGDSSFTGENSLYGDFFGLDDLWTERKEVVEGMVDIYSFWITEFGVDGFRIDTTKHVNMEFWQKFGPDILAAAEAQGIDHFFAFGEVFDQQFGPRFLSEFSTEGQLQSTIDFAFQEAARDFASVGGATDNLRDFFAGDDYYTDADSNAYAMPTFVGNHDMGRIGYFLDRVDQQGADDAELLARSTLAQALMFFSRGQPVIYYGDEQGFVGDGGDKLARQDMFANAVPEYEDDDLIGTDATTSDDNFDQTHPIYQSLADYAAVYQAHQALRSGAQIHRVSVGDAGVYALSRIDRDEQVEYVVALNNSEADQSAIVPTFYGAGMDFNLVIATEAAAATATTDANGDLAVTVPALGLVVYAASAPVTPSDAAPGISMSTLTNDQEVVLAVDDLDGHEVLERIEVGATLDDDGFAEVTFAVSVDGGDYTPIGTDDNAPYRVFFDAAGLEGVPLSFKAIVNDLNGHFASAAVANVTATAEEPPPPGAASYAIIHYSRDDGDYGDHTTGDYNDYWGLHLFGDIEETIEWTAPKPFLGEDEYGRFAWVKLAPGASNVGFIVHRGDTKDGTDADRFFDPSQTPEIWLKGNLDGDDATTYESQAAAQGYATIRYHRDDGDYGTPSPDYNTFWGVHLWGDAIDPAEGTDWTSPKPPDGIDSYGAFWNVLLQDPSAPLNFIIHKGDEKDPGPDQSFVPEDNATVWIQSGDETIYEQRGAAEGVATIHYHRPDGDYGDFTSDNFNDFWGLHVWTGALNPTEWPDPVRATTLDTFGAVYDVPLAEGAEQLAYIIHKGDEKDPGPDQFLSFESSGYEVWQLSGADPEDPYILPLPAAPGQQGDLTKQQAHWVSENTIVWDAAVDPTATYALWYSADGTLELLDNGTVTGGDSIPLARGTAYPSDIDGKLHLGGLPTLLIGEDDLALVPAILKGQVAVVATSAAGIRIGATGVQIPGVLDDLYAYEDDLGVVWDGDIPTIRLWAPTATSVTLHLFDDADPATTSSTVPMTWEDGTWSVTGDASWAGTYYLYEVEVYAPSTGQVEHNLVTDPYSQSLATNSARTQIVDLSDTALQPTGWNETAKPELVAPEDIAIYELHVRDFSVNDPTVAEDLRGTYRAFTVDSNGTAHLEALAEAGLTHLHLLPVFDIATINENKAEWQAPDPDLLATFPPDSEEQQAAVTATADLDGFNWGYDPWHYTTPEGSYSTNPDGPTRVVEFRDMVQSLNESGLRVVMDVVYNHTNASGQAEKSVLDRIVPGYYHRLNADGVVETSTCCANTATEHAMMEKLMIDSVVTWARDYKVDGFRFDLMGHHSKVNMLNVRAALDALTLEDDGVDGSAIYVYGEGWNFGEVADGARFEQATQINMLNTGIGTFNDRIRDAIRGGGPFDGGDSLIANQGYVNGAYYDPNALAAPEADQLAELLLSADQIRVGLAGNLAGFEFVDRDGNPVSGADVDYNGAPTGYTGDPQENISYASAHDNQTLFDMSQYHHPVETTMDDRVRAQNVAMDVTALSQGVPFFHAGVDMLRSKSFDRDSFNSGDWFNSLDFSYATTNWGNGVPVAEKNEAEWDLMKPYLADPDLAPAMGDVEAAVAHLREILEVRMSSPLFRLHTQADIVDRVAFHNTGPNQVPGLIVMSISDTVGDDLDGEADGMWTLFNPTDENVSFTVADLIGEDIVLHPVLAESVDPVVQSSSFDEVSGVFFVPARTTAVFVQLEPDTTAPEVDAELAPIRVLRRIGRFEVQYSCIDDRDPNPTVAADLNGVEVEDGTRVFLITTRHTQRHRWVHGTLFMWSPSFELTVTCTDDAGNTTTVTVEPEFRRRRGVLE